MKTLALCKENIDTFAENKVVLFGDHRNAYFLHDTAYTGKFFNLEVRENWDLVKQRSPEWFKLQKTAKVTGSTLYRALGLESLSDLKSHHYEFIKNRSPPDFPDNVKLRLQYGQTNEKHVIATLVGGLLPSLKPNCFSFLEVGPQFVAVKGEEKFIEVSADGVIRCLKGETCDHGGDFKKENLIPIEAKTVFPDLSKPLEPHYRVPARYVPQCLAQMAVYKSKNHWLLSYTQTSCTLLHLRFHSFLWEKMMETVYDLHGGDKPRVPAKLHPQTSNLREMIKQYTHTHCTFVCEIPSFRGIEGVLKEGEIISPYSVCDVRSPQHLDAAEIQTQCQTIAFEGKPLLYVWLESGTQLATRVDYAPTYVLHVYTICLRFSQRISVSTAFLSL